MSFLGSLLTLLRSWTLISALMLSNHAFASSVSVSCGGSLVCKLAAFENNGNEHIAQLLRDVVYATDLATSTTYSEHEHITCVDTTIALKLGWGPISFPVGFGDGGICMFPENTKQPLTLALIRQLADDVVGKCNTCGAATVQALESTQPANAILKFDYVSKPTCIGNCISPDYPRQGGSGLSSTSTALVVQNDASTTTQQQQATLAIVVTSVATATRSTSTQGPVSSASSDAAANTEAAKVNSAISSRSPVDQGSLVLAFVTMTAWILFM